MSVTLYAGAMPGTNSLMCTPALDAPGACRHGIAKHTGVSHVSRLQSREIPSGYAKLLLCLQALEDVACGHGARGHLESIAERNVRSVARDAALCYAVLCCAMLCYAVLWAPWRGRGP